MREIRLIVLIVDTAWSVLTETVYKTGERTILRHIEKPSGLMSSMNEIGGWRVKIPPAYYLGFYCSTHAISPRNTRFARVARPPNLPPAGVLDARATMVSLC